MKKVIVRYVRFYAPGSFCAEDWTEDAPSLDPSEIAIPDNAYAFTLHERTDVEDGDETYQGAAVQVGPVYYHPGSKVETLAEVGEHPKGNETLLSNMRCNNWDRIIWSRWNNWPQPFDDTKATILEVPK